MACSALLVFEQNTWLREPHPIIACLCAAPDTPLYGFEAGLRPPTRRHTTRCEQAANLSVTPLLVRPPPSAVEMAGTDVESAMV